MKLKTIVIEAISEQLKDLYYNEVLYEGEVMHILKQIQYDYNQHQLDLKQMLNICHKEMYSKGISK